jgi:antitoxin component of MazEF toxin-antitoxin module
MTGAKNGTAVLLHGDHFTARFIYYTPCLTVYTESIIQLPATMIVCKTRKWGNSIGIILPKTELDSLGIANDEEIVVDIHKKDNPLKEMFGAGKGHDLRGALKELRALMRSKY